MARSSSSHRSTSSNSRRQFLRAASRASVAMTTLGLTGVTLVAGQQLPSLTKEERARLDLIQYAIKNLDMEGAIKKHAKEANLDQKGLSILRKLNRTDLKSLQSIQEKLGLANGLIYIRY